MRYIVYYQYLSEIICYCFRLLWSLDLHTMCWWSRIRLR